MKNKKKKILKFIAIDHKLKQSIEQLNMDKTMTMIQNKTKSIKNLDNKLMRRIITYPRHQIFLVLVQQQCYKT